MGPTGKNFAAGMSGGIAYVLDEENRLYRNLNREMVSMEKVENKFDREELKEMLRGPREATGSDKGREILERFDRVSAEIQEDHSGRLQAHDPISAQLEEQGMSRQRSADRGFYASIGGR